MGRSKPFQCDLATGLAMVLAWMTKFTRSNHSSSVLWKNLPPRLGQGSRKVTVFKGSRTQHSHIRATSATTLSCHPISLIRYSVMTGRAVKSLFQLWHFARQTTRVHPGLEATDYCDGRLREPYEHLSGVHPASLSARTLRSPLV